ncbi:MAG TPA: hypothetical protein DCP03_21075 [Polaromonas sp.]|nr:hypothetical protein [Polaromonas sp.]
MTSQADVLQSCLQEAAKAARPALEHCIEDAVAALQVAETQSMKVAERDALATAWRELLKNKAAWSDQYPADLLDLFHANVVAAAQAAWAPAATPAAEHAPTQHAVSTGTSMSGFLSHDTFSLVDDADVLQAIESSRLLQQVLPAVEQTLAELNKLISTVQGLPNVRPELNPLRPDAFAQTLREMLSATLAEPAIASLWISYLADPLGRELNRLYERLVNQLELANVQGASYRVLQTPASAASGRASGKPGDGDGPGSGNGGSGSNIGGWVGGPGAYVSDEPMVQQPSQYADLSNDDIRGELFQDFLFHGGSQAHHGLAPAYYATVEEELAALKAAPESASVPLAESRAAPRPDDQSVPVLDRPQRFVDERSPLSQQVWGAYGRPRERAMVRTQLKKEAQRVGQVLGLEVVRKLVNQVAQDPRLLVPVREAIVALEPSLLRLAMVDPRFFSDEGHAGRRLMERVAQRSFKYNDEFSPEFVAFFEAVTRAFNELNGRSIENAQPFGRALTTLESGWDAQDQRETENRIHALQALRFAEERQTQADQITFDLSKRSDLEKVPGLVLDFLFGPWALAMSHAKLTDTRKQLDPQGFGSVVPDLLWSVKRDVTLKQPAKLIEMIPSLLGKLNAGLVLLGQDPRESAPFFEGLMNLHRPVLKLRRLKSQRDAEESGAVPLELEPEELPASPGQRRAKAAAHPWLGPGDLDAAGFEDTLPTAPGELAPLEEEKEEKKESLAAIPVPSAAAAGDAAEHAAPAPEPAASPAAGTAMARSDAEQQLLGLRAGHWVDLYSRNRWLRAQLIWASSKGTLFMFVSHGGQPHSMTQRSCERLIRERLLRPVEMHGVVAQALDRLVKEAVLADTWALSLGAWANPKKLPE